MRKIVNKLSTKEKKSFSKYAIGLILSDKKRVVQECQKQ